MSELWFTRRMTKRAAEPRWAFARNQPGQLEANIEGARYSQNKASGK